MSKPPSPDEPLAAYPYDRLGNLKTAFFDIFADDKADPPHLDYVNMVQKHTIPKHFSQYVFI